MVTSWQPEDRDDVVGLLDDPARAAVAGAAAQRVAPGEVVGLGSGRALWATMELLARRDELAGMTVVVASSVTERLAEGYGFHPRDLDGEVHPDVYIDGADEVAPDLGLIKGHGAALLREKLVTTASSRFVVVAEAAKRVTRLGEQRTLPVEVVRFAWPDTLHRLQARWGTAVELREQDGAPLVTDEGHHLAELELPGDVAAAEVAAVLDGMVGVVEHGLFLGVADEVLLGASDGTVDVLDADDGAADGDTGA